jgi:phosphoribosylglycinamide formyltransferase 2
VYEALAVGEPGRPIDIRIFGKPNTLRNRRMGVALARAETAEHAVARAVEAAGRVSIKYS